MILAKKLEENKEYWFVFIPNQGINLQSVRLERVKLERTFDDKPDFRVIRTEKSIDFLTVTIQIEPSKGGNYTHLFPLDQKDEAEKLWAKEFFKRFQSISGMDFSEFIKLYKRIQDEHPEWII